MYIIIYKIAAPDYYHHSGDISLKNGDISLFGQRFGPKGENAYVLLLFEEMLKITGIIQPIGMPAYQCVDN